MTLSTENLAFGYSGRTIGRDVTLAVTPGRALALLGPNGGGKTTLLKTMLGLLPPHAGTISLDGEPLSTMPPAQRARHMAYVPQAHAGTFAFAVKDVVLMGRTAHQGVFAKPSIKDREIADAKIAELEISHLADKPYTMISGGERQLVLIARALAQEPRYVVLDEPTANLDFGNQGKVMRQIKALTANGLGVLFTTHDPNQALHFADDATILNNGRILRIGHPRDEITSTSLSYLYGTKIREFWDGDSAAFLST